MNNLPTQKILRVAGSSLGILASLLMVGSLFLVTRPTQFLHPNQNLAFQPVPSPRLPTGGAPSGIQPGTTSPIPTLAYFYIWFDSTSWKRAKTDYPLLGRYTSDDRTVMRQQIRWAKEAGIDGFIVSWKSTNVLNRRLEQLVSLAEEEDFKLTVIYQGLDFDRNPLPVDRINSDLGVFIQRFAGRKPFALFAKPLVIWSGTWEFSREQIAQVSANHRNDVLLLASERSLAGYQRIADLVDGNAYYWSSVNPETHTNYAKKLTALAEAVHHQGGLWVAPAAPGFDARLIGGVTNVDRKNGDTFRTQLNTALASSPDALGIISWNEYSENSHIEPSTVFGSKYLDVLSKINHLPLPAIAEFDSSESAEIPSATGQDEVAKTLTDQRLIAFGALIAMVITALLVIARRTHR